MKTNYYGVYVSPYCNDGEPYVGSPEVSEEACYTACGTDEVCLAVFDNEADAYQRCQYETFKDIYDILEEQCNENNLQFQEDWVHIDTEIGVATVQNEYGRTLASMMF